ncbi:MAG TPA: aspartyl-tRNA amidotransferase [Peptococcaceae bacterium]|nr:MAG: GatB/Yqey [Moorella sp. 60_41]HBT46502.1 aspartyl-tRNA amidotransferase [Peptococcaceae bacterium]
MKERLTRDMKEALKSHDKVRLQTIRMVLAGIKNAEIDKQRLLNDDEVMGLIRREIKLRQEALEQFRQGGREDLVRQAQAEIEVLQKYLPEQLSEEELLSIIKETIREVGAGSTGDVGKVMAALMPKIRGRADGRRANQLVVEYLRQEEAR